MDSCDGTASSVSSACIPDLEDPFTENLLRMKLDGQNLSECMLYDGLASSGNGFTRVTAAHDVTKHQIKSWFNPDWIGPDAESAKASSDKPWEEVLASIIEHTYHLPLMVKNIDEAFAVLSVIPDHIHDLMNAMLEDMKRVLEMVNFTDLSEDEVYQRLFNSLSEVISQYTKISDKTGMIRCLKRLREVCHMMVFPAAWRVSLNSEIAHRLWTEFWASLLEFFQDFEINETDCEKKIGISLQRCGISQLTMEVDEMTRIHVCPDLQLVIQRHSTGDKQSCELLTEVPLCVFEINSHDHDKHDISISDDDEWNDNCMSPQHFCELQSNLIPTKKSPDPSVGFKSAYGCIIDHNRVCFTGLFLQPRKMDEMLQDAEYRTDQQFQQPVMVHSRSLNIFEPGHLTAFFKYMMILMWNQCKCAN